MESINQERQEPAATTSIMPDMEKLPETTEMAALAEPGCSTELSENTNEDILIQELHERLNRTVSKKKQLQG